VKSQKDQLADALAAMSAGNPSAPANIEPTGASAPDAGAREMSIGAPAPDRSVFAPKFRTADLLAQQRLNTQRTAIPILLTCGVLLPAIGSLKWLAGADSVFAHWDIVLPIVLAVAGVLLLVVAVINMLHVRDALRRQNANH
jgi:hypothetical protein